MAVEFKKVHFFTFTQRSRDSSTHGQALCGVGILCFPFKKPLLTRERLEIKEKGQMFKEKHWLLQD